MFHPLKQELSHEMKILKNLITIDVWASAFLKEESQDLNCIWPNFYHK
jgi:hypothetical protein